MKHSILKTIGYSLLISLFALFSCKTVQKQVVTTEETPVKEDTISMVKKEQQGISSISAQFKLEIEGYNLFSFSGTAYSIIDKEFMISIKALFGIEVMRVYCTPTKAVVLDKLGRRYCEVPFELLEPELGTDFYGVQGLFTNRTFDPDKNNYANFTIDVVNGDWIMSHNGENFQTEFLLQAGKHLQRSIIRSVKTGDFFMATYTDLREQNGITFPYKYQFLFQSKKQNNAVNVTFQQLQFNQTNAIDFEIPAGYKAVTVEQLQKELMSL